MPTESCFFTVETFVITSIVFIENLILMPVSPPEFFFVDTDNSPNSRGKEGTIFILLGHFQRLRHSDIAIFHIRFLTRIFNRTAYNYQTVTRRNLNLDV